MVPVCSWHMNLLMNLKRGWNLKGLQENCIKSNAD